MATRSTTSRGRRLLSRLAPLALLIATVPGCLATSWVEKNARGEPREAGEFALTTSTNTYEITRWWGTGQGSYEGLETATIQRGNLPKDCKSARFFLNDSEHELTIAQPATAQWVTAARPPLPSDSFPPCALLVSYGSFSESPPLEGVAVTSATGLVTRSERQQPHPVAWALLPAGIVADAYVFLGALVTMPVWAPIGLMMENHESKHKRDTKEKKRGALPPPIASCWITIDNLMKNGGESNPNQQFVEFEWSPDTENAYAHTTADGIFSEEKPLPTDARVTLRQGRVKFRINGKGFLWTDADVECGLRAGNVVATRVILRK